MTVTFFGHKDTPELVVPCLEKTLRHLIENENAGLFYVGNHGKFDGYALRVLKKLKIEFPHIEYAIVLAYMPNTSQYTHGDTEYTTVLPEEAAISIPKFAICRRNDWMLQKSDTIIGYITRSFGGAAQYYQKAIKKKKSVINLADML